MCVNKARAESVPLGLIRQHLVSHQERQPPGTNLTTVPTDNTTRQEMSLDAQMAVVESNIETNEDGMDRRIRTQKDGSWEEVMVDASSLHQALGLLLHDLLENGSHHGHVHSETFVLILKKLIMDPPQRRNQSKI